MAATVCSFLAPSRPLVHHAKQQQNAQTARTSVKGTRRDALSHNLSSNLHSRQSMAASRGLVVASTGRKLVNVAVSVQQTSTQTSGGKVDRIPVTFALKHDVKFGEVVGIIGSPPELGCWNTDNILMLNWSEGNVWTATTDLDTAFIHEFKAVVTQKDGNIIWQPTKSNANLDLTVLEKMPSIKEVRAELLSFNDFKVEMILPSAIPAAKTNTVPVAISPVMPVITAIPKMPAQTEKNKEETKSEPEAPAAQVEVEMVEKVEEAKAEVTPVVETVEEVKEEEIPEENEEDTQITAEMGGTMILKREAAKAAEGDAAVAAKADPATLTVLFVVLGVAGLVGGAGMFKYALDGKALIDGIQLPQLPFPPSPFP